MAPLLYQAVSCRSAASARRGRACSKSSSAIAEGDGGACRQRCSVLCIIRRGCVHQLAKDAYYVEQLNVMC